MKTHKHTGRSQTSQRVARGSLRRMVGALDLRTIEGRKKEIIQQVKQGGGFSIFWITANQLRACVAGKMFETGELTVDGKSQYPWEKVRVAKRPNADISRRTVENK